MVKIFGKGLSNPMMATKTFDGFENIKSFKSTEMLKYMSKVSFLSFPWKDWKSQYFIDVNIFPVLKYTCFLNFIKSFLFVKKIS